jgi:hypothetical protein
LCLMLYCCYIVYCRVTAVAHAAPHVLCIVPVSSQQGGTLKAMRELLHAGERLGVGVAATAALRARIRRREWEDSARKALSTKSSVAALSGVCRIVCGLPLLKVQDVLDVILFCEDYCMDWSELAMQQLQILVMQSSRPWSPSSANVVCACSSVSATGLLTSTSRPWLPSLHAYIIKSHKHCACVWLCLLLQMCWRRPAAWGLSPPTRPKPSRAA